MQQEFKDDLLKEYFNTSVIENAPAGFTEKILTMVSLESKPARRRKKLHSGYAVPLISVTVTLILTITALLLPAAGNEFQGMPWLKLVKNIKLPALDLNLDTILNFSVPDYLPYLFLCILVLTIFDRGLSILFHKGK
jgi:amino acid transporter